MRRGEVYLCPFGRHDATGQEHLIPVVVLTRDAINRSGPVVLVAPLREGSGRAPRAPGAVPLRAPEGGLATDSVILTLHLRAVPRAQLRRRLGTLSATALRELNRTLCSTLDLGLPPP